MKSSKISKAKGGMHQQRLGTTAVGCARHGLTWC